MRYIMCLNSQWFKNYQSSKLKAPKKSLFPYLNGLFFVLSTLTAGGFWSTGSSDTLCTSFENPYQYPNGFRRAKVWQHFYLLPYPFKKSHFTPYKRQGWLLIYYRLYIGHRLSKNNQHCVPSVASLQHWKKRNATAWKFYKFMFHRAIDHH